MTMFSEYRNNTRSRSMCLGAPDRPSEVPEEPATEDAEEGPGEEEDQADGFY
jgi:hypothetical protein